MKENYSLRAVLITLNMPFDHASNIDFESYGRLIQHHLAEGAVDFLAPAQAGEVNELSCEERIEMIRFVKEVSGDRVVFFACATAAMDSESMAVAEAAVRIRCGAVLAEAPASCRGDRAASKKFFRAMASLHMPVLAIQDLDRKGPGLPVEDIVDLFETVPAFRCLKIEVQPPVRNTARCWRRPEGVCTYRVDGLPAR